MARERSQEDSRAEAEVRSQNAEEVEAFLHNIDYVRVYGSTVNVAGSETVAWGGKMPNAGKTEHLRFTGIWMKQGKRWQQVARHANVVPQ